MKFSSFLLLMAFWTIVGCQSSPNDDIMNAPPLAAPDQSEILHTIDMKIAPMDLLEISIFGASDLDGSYQVDFEGQLKMPLIEPFKAAGFTPTELGILLRSKLGDKYLQNPEVTVRIAESQGRFLTVDGSVRSPGLYPVEGRMSLLQAVAQSGGPSENANPSRVVIFRTINGERKAAGFNLKKIREGEANDPDVYVNDIIVVDGSEARRNYGEVLRSLPLMALFLAF